VVSGPVGSADPTVRVRVNGELTECPAGWTLADLVRSRCPSDRGVAVAVDLEVVPRSEWTAVRPAEGSSIEIVTAAAGG